MGKYPYRKNRKFLSRINRNYFSLFAIVVFLISFGGYFILRFTVIHEAKEQLLSRATTITNQIRETGQIRNSNPGTEIHILTDKTDALAEFKIITIYNKQENELEPYLEYTGFAEIDGIQYKIILRQPTFEFEDLIIILTITLFVLLITAFLVFYFISKKVNKTIWARFEENLGAIESFRFSDSDRLVLNNTNIEEFDRLNRVVENLTGKLKSDYDALKEFTENASHELQTPLATISLNLEEILQQDMDSESFQKIATAMQAIKRLSKLNQSLLLLTKIENRQFEPKSEVTFNKLIAYKKEEFSVLFDTKSITVNYTENGTFKHFMSEQLADILLNNLISNAVNHNRYKGRIEILTGDQYIKICNTGDSNSLTNETIFNRFSKGNSKSYGLGLSIVKKICDTHNLTISYSNDDIHCFLIQKTEFKS
ncbi:sensor histidine kinase [Saccharicrinis sp. FJH54]|uniref:sensor histidine kinase n=1 Tax=Saccharicrinis sp. FJH54 TaxID=3344665 RepID=UPI0035D49D0B